MAAVVCVKPGAVSKRILAPRLHCDSTYAGTGASVGGRVESVGLSSVYTGKDAQETMSSVDEWYIRVGRRTMPSVAAAGEMSFLTGSPS